MVEPSVAVHRKFVGNACLYRHLALRRPPFLARNINKALDGFEKALARSKEAAADAIAVDEPADGEMSASERVRAGWNYPTKEMMEDLLKGQKPTLRLDGLRIRHCEKPEVESRDGLRLQKVKTEDDWLPDPSIDFSAPCLITLMFINSGKDLNRQERIHVDTRTGTIESSVAATKERIFDITLDEVFSIEVEKIYVTVERGTNGNGTYRWKRTIPAHYQLNVEIKCLDHSDAKQLLGLMEMKSVSKYRTSLAEEDATLRASWYDLPECPPRGKLLAMTRTDGPRHLTNMKFGVELSMGWSRKKDSPLTIHAKKRRAALIPDQVQLPTPSASDDSGDVVKHYSVTYIFMDKRFHTMKNLQCPLCATAISARAQQKFTSFDRLHTHMLLWHDHFHPRVEMTGHHHSQGVSSFEYTVRLTLAPTSTERIVQPKWPGDEECWIAPKRPFDEKAYLRGEDTWTGHHQKRAERPQLNATKKQPSSGPAPSRVARPALSEINDLPELRKERWKIPKVPRVRFYRTKSKRPFEADEEVSESDESVDESWLQAHKRDDMSSLPISEGGRDFYQDWNFAAKEDDFPADLFIRECLVRFARRFSDKMWDDEYYAEFMKMVDRLHALKLIDSEVHDYCSDCRSLRSRDSDRPVGGKRLRDTEDMSNRRQKKKASGQPPGGQGRKTCSCGSLVVSARAAVTCHNIRCSRVLYHMECIGLSRRPENWQCADCHSREGGSGAL